MHGAQQMKFILLANSQKKESDTQFHPYPLPSPLHLINCFSKYVIHVNYLCKYFLSKFSNSIINFIILVIIHNINKEYLSIYLFYYLTKVSIFNNILFNIHNESSNLFWIIMSHNIYIMCVSVCVSVCPSMFQHRK